MMTMVANAAPLSLTHQARVLDAQGSPIQGPINLHAALWDDATDTAMTHRLWEQTFETTAADGYVTVRLDDVQTSWASGPMWLELTVAGASMGRMPLGSVPHAGLAEAVRVVTELPSTCTDGELVVQSGTQPRLWMCVAGEWSSTGSGGSSGDGSSPGTASDSCKSIRDAGQSQGSGLYWLDDGSGDPRRAYQVWCDQETAGGGWTLVVRSVQANTSTDFHFNGSAWTDGLGEVSSFGSSHVSRAWTLLQAPTEALFMRDDTTQVAQGSIADCVAGGTLATASGLCSDLDSNSDLYTVFGYYGSSHLGMGFNMRSPTSTCDIRARVYFGTNIWDGGDSEVINGLGYNYRVGNQYSSSCSCPYSNYCGTGLWNGNTLDTDMRVWMFVR